MLLIEIIASLFNRSALVCEVQAYAEEKIKQDMMIEELIERISEKKSITPIVYAIPHWLMCILRLSNINTTTSCAFINRQLILLNIGDSNINGTYIHELVHVLAKNNIERTIFSGFHVNKDCEAFNEACTEYIAVSCIEKEPIKSSSSKYKASAYLIFEFAKKIGVKTFLDMYFNSDISAMNNLIEIYSGMEAKKFLQGFEKLNRAYNTFLVSELESSLSKMAEGFLEIQNQRQ